jgi:hypothetical protein
MIADVTKKHVNSPMELTVAKENLFKSHKLELIPVVHELMAFLIMKILVSATNSTYVIRVQPMKCLV